MLNGPVPPIKETLRWIVIAGGLAAAVVVAGCNAKTNGLSGTDATNPPGSQAGVYSNRAAKQQAAAREEHSHPTATAGGTGEQMTPADREQIKSASQPSTNLNAAAPMISTPASGPQGEPLPAAHSAAAHAGAGGPGAGTSSGRAITLSNGHTVNAGSVQHHP